MNLGNVVAELYGLEVHFAQYPVSGSDDAAHKSIDDFRLAGQQRFQVFSGNADDIRRAHGSQGGAMLGSVYKAHFAGQVSRAQNMQRNGVAARRGAFYRQCTRGNDMQGLIRMALLDESLLVLERPRGGDCRQVIALSIVEVAD